MEAGFQPYEGGEPFLFVSYSHDDNDRVIPLLDALHAAGYRVWYDDGIHPGEKWKDTIADHIARCAVLLAFHSSHSAKSPHCEAEIDEAIRRKKTVISLYLEKKVELRPGQRMYLDSYQSVPPAGLAKDKLLARFRETAAVEACRSDNETPPPAKRWPHILRRVVPVLLALLALAVLMAAGAAARYLVTKPRWSLDENGTLYLSKGPLSSGKLPDYDLQIYTVTRDGRELTEAFSDSPWLKEKEKIRIVVVEDGVTRLGRGAFAGCPNLSMVYLPESLTTIGAYAFNRCVSLADVTIPGRVVDIEEYAFNQCDGLSEVTFHSPSKCSKIGGHAFAGCTSLASVEIPNSVGWIDKEAFRFCTSLTSVEIPDSVQRIFSGTFQGCTSLTSVEIPNSVGLIETEAFAGCTSLTSVEIPDSVYRIFGGTFFGCTSLTSVEIPDSVTMIFQYAFQDCTSLASVTVPANAKIYGGAFPATTEVIYREAQ